MTLILSGSDGLSDIDGSAGTPAIRGTDANTGIFFPAADTIAFAEGGTEAMRIDSSGNVGIGVTPSSWSGSRALQLSNGVGVSSVNGSNNTQFTNNAYWNNSGWIYIASDYANKYSQISGTHIWYTASSGTAGNAVTFNESMRIDSSGNLLVNTTTTANAGKMKLNFSGATQNGIVIESDTASASGSMLFKNTNGVVGNITTTSSSTAFNTSSDYRLKENIAPMTGALTKVTQLKPVTYKWKVDGSDGEGFIAHELAEVCPHAVSGEKDAVDADGNPVYQGIDVSFLVATLTAALQETKALIDQQAETINALTARLVALEGQ